MINNGAVLVYTLRGVKENGDPRKKGDQGKVVFRRTWHPGEIAPEEDGARRKMVPRGDGTRCKCWLQGRP